MALIDLSRRKSAPFTARRMATLGFFVTLLIVVGWLHFTGAAATRGDDTASTPRNNTSCRNARYDAAGRESADSPAARTAKARGAAFDSTLRWALVTARRG